METDNSNNTQHLNEELESLKSTETSLWRLFKTLLSPKTMPHIVLISVLSVLLHIMSSADSLTNFSAVAFIGLSTGYAVTAIGSKNERIRGWTTSKSIDDDVASNIFTGFFKKFKICIFPLIVAAFTIVLTYTIFGENGIIPGMYELIPLFLGSLFVIWAIVQGVSFSTWASSISAKKTKEDGRVSNLKFSTVVNGTILMIFSVIILTIFQFIKKPSSSIIDIFIENWIYLGLVIIVFSSTTAWTWKIRSLGKHSKSLDSFSNRWTLICHLFLSWHILTVWRQNFMSPNTIEIFIEEILLMIFTVFMAIWSLTSKGYATKFKLLNEENSLPWGLAFGYAYAGSVAMLTNVFDEITTVMTIGHIIVILTVIYIHRKILLNVFSKHDDEIIVKRLAEKSNIEVENDSNGSTDLSDQEVLPDNSSEIKHEESEDWQEDEDVDWDKKEEGNTISEDVEWEKEVIEMD